MTARVRSVSAWPTVFASTFAVPRSTSAKTGRCPASTTAFAHATQVNDGSTTSDPGGRSSARTARCSAFDPLSVIAKSRPRRLPNSASNSRTRGPMPIQPSRTLGVRASISSRPVAAPNTSTCRTTSSLPSTAGESRAGCEEGLGGLFGEERLVGLFLGVRAGARDERGANPVRDRLLGDHALGDVLAGRKLEHHVEQRRLDDRPKPASPGLAHERPVGDLPERVVGEDELDVVVPEEPLVLLRERVLRLHQDLHEVLALELVHGRDDRESADELGDQAEREQVLRHDAREQLALLRVVLRADVRAEADRVLADPLRDDLVEAGERAAADEEDVGRVDREELLVRVLAAALRRDRGERPLEDLQERLLDALPRHVARDRRVVRLARDLVDLVDVDDPGLGLLDVEVRGLDQLQKDVLDVLADVAGLRERGRVGDRERDVEDPRERLREERLAATGRPEQQDVRLLQL